jgi:hypothetical protein
MTSSGCGYHQDSQSFESKNSPLTMSAASGDPNWNNQKMNETIPISLYRYSGSLHTAPYEVNDSNTGLELCSKAPAKRGNSSRTMKRKSLEGVTKQMVTPSQNRHNMALLTHGLTTLNHHLPPQPPQ